MSKTKDSPHNLDLKKRTDETPFSNLSDYKKIISAIKKEEKERKSEKNPKQSSKAGLSPGLKRATFIIKEEHFQKLKALAYEERVTVKAIMDHVLEHFLSSR